MRTTWSALYQSLHRSLNRTSAENAFQALKHHHPDLRPFASIPALLRHLQRVDDNPAGRYLVIRHLVEAAQAAENSRPAAVTLVIVALWPGLDGVYRRVRRDFPDDYVDLAADLLARLTEAIAGVDLGKVRSVAGTLIRNVERDIRRELIRTRKRAELACDFTNPVVEAAVAPELGSRQLCRDLDDLLVGLSPDNIALLTRVLVLGETQQEAGRALGLSPSAARKRFQRSIRHLQVLGRVGCPVPAPRLAFPKSKDRRGPQKGG